MTVGDGASVDVHTLRLETELLDRGVGTRMFVGGDALFGAGLLVGAGRDRCQLLCGPTRRDGLAGALLRLDREAVLGLARDAVLLGDAFGRLAHRERAVQRF